MTPALRYAAGFSLREIKKSLQGAWSGEGPQPLPASCCGGSYVNRFPSDR